MIEIVDVKVNWSLRKLQIPIFWVTLSALPSQFLYREYGPPDNKLYYAESEGMIKYFWHHPQDETGHGGQTFRLVMESGEERSVKGPWASGTHQVHALGLFDTMMVWYSLDPDAIHKGWPFEVGYLNLEMARTLAEMTDTKIVRVNYADDSYYYVPARSDYPFGTDIFRTVGGRASYRTMGRPHYAQ